ESTFRASRVALGRDEVPESKTGALIGGAIWTEAAIAASQSSVGAIDTACGCVPELEAGYTASATPAASATGSVPATRLVFLVATEGKPSFCPACGVLAWTPTAGPVTTSLDVPPHAASNAHSAA